MLNGLKSNGLLSTRMFTSCVLFLVLFTLLTAFSSFAIAQDQQDPQEPNIYYLKNNQEQSNHWEQTDFWYEANVSGTVIVVPSRVSNSIFVVGNTFHLRPNRPNGPDIYYPEVGKYDTTFGYYHGIGSHTNKLYIGYKVDLTTGTVDLKDYSEGIYGVLHLKTQADRPNEGKITVDNLYVGRGEIFQGETDSTINLHGSITIQGDLRFRNVAEDKNKDIRILNIHSDIHGDGILQFEAGKSRENHIAEIYLMSSENDFSGKVCVESGTHVHIDDPHEQQDFYDYQTHLFLTGENALYKASIVLNEGIVKITADQTFHNYFSGIDEHQEGVFNGIGTLIIDNGNKPVAVTLSYDDAETLRKPLGLITASDKSTLTFDLPDADEIKKMTMSEADNNYSKIESQGKLVKTGDGTLQIIAASQGLVGAESFVISSGRLDMQGYFTGDVIIGEELPDPDTGYTRATFSPGDVIGSVANIIGDFDVNDYSTLAFEQNASGMDKIVANNVEVSSHTIFDLTMNSYEPGAVYPILVQSGAYEGDYANSSFWDSLLSPASQPYWTLFVSGDTVYAKIKDDAPVPSFVPEPSTWTLLILGSAGLLYWRKRK